MRSKGFRFLLSFAFILAMVFSAAFKITTAQAGVTTPGAPTTQTGENNCAASVSSSLVVHLPIVTYSGSNYWADLKYNSADSTLSVSNAGLVSDMSPYSNCTASTLSSDYKLHIPVIILNNVSYWVDLQYNGSVFVITGSGASGPALLSRPDWERTVIDSIRGGVYLVPFNGELAKLGLEIGYPGEFEYGKMAPTAIMGIQSVFHLIEVEPINGMHLDRFPVDALLKYEANEVSLGRPRFIVTKNGKEVLNENDYVNPALPHVKEELIRARDDRYIHYFINMYVRKLMKENIGLDECYFTDNVYMTLNGTSPESAKTPYDPPFAQNNTDLLGDATYFFKRIGDLAPDIQRICNRGYLYNMSEADYQKVFEPTDGRNFEEFLRAEVPGDDYKRDLVWSYDLKPLEPVQFDYKKIQVFDFPIDSDAKGNPIPDRVRDSLVAFLAFSGPNGFFGLRMDGDAGEIDPKLYEDMAAMLGTPVGAPLSVKAKDKSEGWRLHWREVQGGLVYYNRTGSTHTVTLPTGKTYYDENGNVATLLTLDDHRGRYVTTEKGNRAARVTINPRMPGLISDSVPVVLDTTTDGATIRYTLDGSEPTAISDVYGQSIVLTKSAVIKARAFKGGLLPGFTNQATYNLTSEPPQVEFHLAQDEGSGFLDSVFPLVRLTNVSHDPVTVQYNATGGTAQSGTDYTLTAGSLTIETGRLYGHFPVTIMANQSWSGNKTIEITLSAPKNATLGYQKTFIFTIINP